MVHTHFLKPLLGAALLTLFLSLWVGITEAQILDVQQKGSYLVVIGDQNRQVSSLPIGSNDEFWGCRLPFSWFVKVPTSIPTMNDLVRSPLCRWGHRIVFGALPEIISMSKRVPLSTPTIGIANKPTPGPRIKI